MVSESSRAGLTPFMSGHLILAFCQFLCAIFGLLVFSQYTIVPCADEVIDRRVVYALLLASVITQLFDVTVLTCCFGVVYQWKRVEFKAGTKLRRSFLAHKFDELVTSPNKSDLSIKTEPVQDFRNNTISTIKHLCKCAQILSCNLFGGGNVGTDIQTVSQILCCPLLKA